MAHENLPNCTECEALTICLNPVIDRGTYQCLTNRELVEEESTQAVDALTTIRAVQSDPPIVPWRKPRGFGPGKTPSLGRR